MCVSYGIEVDEESTGIDYIQIAEESLTVFSEIFVPGKYLVETFPILRHVPGWMPGAAFKRNSTAWKRIHSRLVEIPWMKTKEALVRGTDYRRVSVQSI